MGLILLTFSGLTVGAISLLLWPALNLRHDAREPPLIKPALPFFGHILNLIRYSNSYYTKLHARHPRLACYTLNLYSSKAYVVQSPELVAAVQRNAKTLVFDPLVLLAAKIVFWNE